MNIKEHTTPAKLEYYSFWWSEVRLIVAAVALLVGGYPPIYFVTPSFLYGIVGLGLKLAWIISGVAAAYLLYRWFTGGQKVFGGGDKKDMVTFLIMCVTGINLGFVGLLGKNVGMSLAYGKVVFMITGLAYLATSAYLYKRWGASGQRLFI